MANVEMSRRQFLTRMAEAGIIGASALAIAEGLIVYTRNGSASSLSSPDHSDSTTGATTPGATDAAASTAPSAAPTLTPEKGLGEQIVDPMTIPSVISGDMVRSLKQGGKFPTYTEGQWMLPAYDEFEADKAHNWRGIGPWYPEAFRNIDSDAAHLSTHGNPGETIIVGDKGGKVEFAFSQLGPHQRDGAMNGNGETNPDWTMQITFKGMKPFQEMWLVDPDTGRQLTWSDGTPVVYKSSELGDASFAIPATEKNQDVRVGFVFDMAGQTAGEQKPEIKIERGPNDHPTLKGENLLPDAVIKPSVSEK